MIYRYDTRNIVEFKNNKRASYSARRYGTLLEKVTKLSHSLDKKIWNYYEIEGEVTKLFYYNQATSQEVIILIDTEDFEKVSDRYWTLNSNGYAFSRQGNKRIFLHNLILGFDESKDVTDHKDRNKLNNRKKNLHRVSYNFNSYNRNMQANNTSSVTGVDNHRGRWRARIQYKDFNRTKTFDTFEEAVKCRREWEKELAVKFNDYHESE